MSEACAVFVDALKIIARGRRNLKSDKMTAHSMQMLARKTLRESGLDWSLPYVHKPKRPPRPQNPKVEKSRRIDPEEMFALAMKGKSYGRR